ncbi:MAG: alpha-2-macroglobulin family protein, partial [Proteobacteria bacterium]
MRHIKWILFIAVFALSACGDSSDEQSQQQADNKVTKSQIDQTTTGQETDGESAQIVVSHGGEFQVLNISEGIYDNTAALQINVNQPLDRQQDFNRLIQVTEAGQSIQPAWIVGEQALALYYPFIKTDTEYSLKVSQSLQSQQGKSLTQNHQKTLKTQPAQQTVRFLSQGYTLLPSDKALPIEAVNVNAVDLKFWRIHTNQLHQFPQNPHKTSTYQLRELAKIADLAYTAQFALDSTANKTEQHQIPIHGIDALSPAGVYFVTMMGAENYDYDYASTWFIHTDIALHSRQYGESMALFAQQLPKASPYQNVQLTAYNHKGNVQAEALTDAAGFAQLPTSGREKTQFIVAEKDDQIQILRLNEPKLDLSEYPISGRHYQAQELFLYAPRDLYRPGETVHINGLLRNDDGRFERALPLTVDIKRPDNRVIRHFNWAGDGEGFYSTAFDLPDNAMTGQWQFVVHLSDKRRFQYDFSVQDFLPERLTMTLKPESKLISTDSAANINIQADYLYGAPAAGNRFDATVTLSSAQKLFEDYSDYQFGANHYQEFNDSFTVDSAQLSEAGTGTLIIPNKWQNTQFPLNLTAHINVYEAGGRPLSRYSRLQVWPHDRAVGIKPLWDSRFADPNSNNGFELIAVNKAGEQIDMADAQLLLIKENSQRYWHWGDDGWAYRNQDEEQTVYSAMQPLTAAQAVRIQLPIQYGQYRLEIRDSQQNTLSSYRFFAGWRWYDPNNLQAEKPDQVKLKWQNHAVTPGQSAALSVQAPFAGTAIITVESDELLWHHVQVLDQAHTEIKIPIDQNWQRHDIYAAVTVIKAGQPKRKHLPQRALGLIHVPLDKQARQLDVELSHASKVLPDNTLTVKVKVNNIDSNANLKSFVTLAAVDTGVLNVSQFKTPDPFAWFFDPRQYAPAIHDMYGRLIALIDAKKAMQKFGGDADISRGGDKPKSEVQIVSILSDKVLLNAQGEADIDFKLPYFNGELRLMALAFNDAQIGSKDSTVKVAAPVVIEASLPRFLAKGDQSTAVIEVHNTEPQALKLQLKITADQALGGQKLEQEISLNADEKQRIQLALSGNNHHGQGQLRVQAQADDSDFSMDRQWSLGLRPARPAITRQHSFVINPGETISNQADWHNHFETDGLKAILTLSDTVILAEEQQLAELLQYPYGCLEQTTSRAWPLMLAEQKDFTVYAKSSNADLYQKRHEYLETAIGRILSMQKSNGGFGAWSSDSYEANWLTVFATDFLITAKNQAYSVPDKALQKATERLRHYVQSQFYLQSDFSRYLSHPHNFRISVKAYAAYVLAQSQQISVGDVRRVYDSLTTTINSPLPLAHLARALELLGDQKRATEAWQQVVDFKWQADRYAYYGNYGSKIRDYTAVVQLGLESPLLQQSPQSVMPLLPEIKAELQQRRWLSTQERGILFRTAKLLGQQSAGEWLVNLTNQGHKTSIERDQDLINVYVEQDAQTKISLENTGQKTVFADWTYQGYPNKPVALKEGVGVTKRYYDLSGKVLDLSRVRTGDLVLVKITASLDKQFNYLP